MRSKESGALGTQGKTRIPTTLTLTVCEYEIKLQSKPTHLTKTNQRTSPHPLAPAEAPSALAPTKSIKNPHHAIRTHSELVGPSTGSPVRVADSEPVVAPIPEPDSVYENTDSDEEPWEVENLPKGELGYVKSST